MLALTCGLLVHSLQAQSAVEAGALAKEILKATGVKGGLIVHLGIGDGQLTGALRVGEQYQVQGLDRSWPKVEAARANLKKLDVYGPVSVDRLQGGVLPYIDNLINLVVVEDLSGISMPEIMRVLCPNGVAYVKQGGAWQKTVKSRPPEMDEWTHYYYDARGNPASKDLVVAPPERLQWVGSPRWSRHHDRMSSLSAQVSAGGRLFYIMDEGSRISILLPSKWFLTARDAFNGTILWKRPIAEWQTHLWPLKSGPTQLARRLVAMGQHVYATLSINDPVSCLDAATGETVREYANTAGAEEIVMVNGVLYVLVNPELWVLHDFAPKQNTGDQKRVETEFNWDEKKRLLVAVEAATGKLLWKQEAKVAPLTLAADGQRVVYHNGESIVSLDPASGKQQWKSTPMGKRRLFEFNYGPRVVLHGEVVLYAGGDGAMKGVAAASGKELWSAPHQKSGYRSPEDLIITGGLVWNAPTTSGTMSGAFSGRDPLTGEVKVEFPPDVDTYWFHHRCYIAKATERFILPSRTGIEFVDINKKSWEINHWVRGACLYGVMPCNGLVYAGPHNCACYPEAKLDGMNALAPGTMSAHPKPRPDAERFEQGPAYGQPLQELAAHVNDWPTYRHDAARSGHTDQPLSDNLEESWKVELSGRLSAPTIADGKVFVAQVDQHMVHALRADSGGIQWTYIAGGRVDSPPTYWQGRVLFGCMDGYVYCLRADDGALIWRFHAAAIDRRHTAFEQIESVWPVHGSVLVENGVVSCVAGRSVFLDGGLRFVRLDAATGKKLVETVFNEKDPETGLNLQTRVKTLQMPVGLNDVLSGDGHYIYLRTQKIKPDGIRVDIGPISGNAAQQGGAQRGEGAHIFAPTGFLDDSWFHRSYWVYGKSFAGGHNGYYQAGKYAPSGQILVFDDKTVYGYGRLSQYFKWTTTMERQMFAASKEAPEVPIQALPVGGNQKKGKAKGKAAVAAPGPKTPRITFDDSPKLDPANQAITVAAWIEPHDKDGVIVSHGGGNHGYALTLQDAIPAFSVRATKQETTATAARPLGDGWHHVAGVLGLDKSVCIYVDGQLAAQTKAPSLIPQKPNLGLFLGGTGNSLVTSHGNGEPFTGTLDQFFLYHRALDAGEIAELMNQGKRGNKSQGLVLACSFDTGTARDESGNGIHGVATGTETAKGKVGSAMLFPNPTENLAAAVPAGKAGITNVPARAGSFVKNQWERKVPSFTRAMAMAGKKIFISGPPDTIDEEYAFERLTKHDKAVKQDLAEQDAALDGKRGASLFALDMDSGKMGEGIDMQSPPVWDGMAVARGCLFMSTQDGKVICYGKPKN
ncbi:MAG: PQQ-binding-like beta-propeller repeat protein [Verrucomicrobiota bacterium]